MSGYDSTEGCYSSMLVMGDNAKSHAEVNSKDGNVYIRLGRWPQQTDIAMSKTQADQLMHELQFALQAAGSEVPA